LQNLINNPVHKKANEDHAHDVHTTRKRRKGKKIKPTNDE